MNYATITRSLGVALTAWSVLASPVQAQNVRPGYWTISVSYPRFTATGPVAAKANSVCRKIESVDAKEFLAMAKAEVPELKKSGSAATYALNVVPTVTIDTPSLCSGYVERRSATGGANGNATFRAFNYARTNNGVREIALKDLFLKASHPVDEASAAILEVLKSRPTPPSSVASGGWKRLTNAEAKQFVITKKGLLFLFDKSDLGSGAEGTIKATVPFALLPGLRRDGILKPVLVGIKAPVSPRLTDGRWQVVAIKYNDDKVLRSTSMDDNWVEFTDGRVQGKAGINRFSGSYHAQSDGRIKIGAAAMTRAANPPDSLSSHFEKDFPQATRYMFRNAELILELPYDTGIIELRRR